MQVTGGWFGELGRGSLRFVVGDMYFELLDLDLRTVPTLWTLCGLHGYG
jgi:hypothetical protein